MLSVAATVGTFAYIPATIILTRTEAALLPPGNQMVVWKDSRDVSVKHGREGGDNGGEIGTGYFGRAFRSVDRALVLRILLNYVQWSVALFAATGLHVW